MSEPAPEELVARALRLLDGAKAHHRTILGITGPPGAGKSTLAAWLVGQVQQARPGEVALVGMDAFHLAGNVLGERGLTAVKGAPETFDALGYAALLRRLRDESDATIYAPVFHRELEESLAHEAEVSARVGLVVTEGNYLLLDTPPWDAVGAALDECWFVAADERVRLARLVARHEAYGRPAQEAHERAYGSDLANARIVSATQPRAYLRITAR